METLMIGLRVLVSLGAVLALLWWLQRRLSRGPRAAKVNPVTVIAKQGIGAKASVVVIDVEGQRLVLGVTEQAVSVLQSGEAPEPEPAVEFAKAMDAVALVEPRAVLNSRQFDDRARRDPLAGSIFSPDTWRQAAMTLRRAR